ncbi:thiamine phosphate synthase [Desulfofundulus sp.]|uniref:thiamine phosphate synthase n=1 Tax=Desulfofundulus sp. TaxID=2282750 RepID=UPI003C764886
MGELYRVLDANFNRAREGLRVVEEVARFILDDAGMTMRIRDMRHRLGIWQESFPGRGTVLVEARDVEGDVAAPAPAARGEEQNTIIQLVMANFKRVQEATRVLEEYARLLPVAAPFKDIRYAAYLVEKEMVSRLVQLGAFGSPSCQPGTCGIDYSLYVITGDKFSRGRSILEVARAAIEGGATVLQLREKEFTARQLIDVGHQLRRLTREKGVTFIVNDRVDVALAVDADGVHLGQDDLPVGMARRILGPGKIIGISTHSVEQALEAQRQGADYIGVGPVFETHTKDDVQAPVGVDLVRQVASAVSIPKVAIGGIKAGNVEEVIAAGADGAAVITAVVAAEDVSGAARELRSRIDKARRYLK